MEQDLRFMDEALQLAREAARYHICPLKRLCELQE